MRLWADSTGAVVEYDLTETYDPATAYPRSYEFDEDTNPALVQDLLANISHYTIGLASNLRKDGALVTPAVGGRDFQDRQAVRSIIIKLLQDVDLTPAEDRVVLRFLLRHAAGRRLASGPGK